MKLFVPVALGCAGDTSVQWPNVMLGGWWSGGWG